MARSPWLVVLAGIFLLAPLPAQADKIGVPLSLTIEPATITQGDDSRTILKTTVTLASPSPDFFICELRSEDRQKLACDSIIFKKGDTVGTGTATINWTNVQLDSAIKVTAYNIDAPDTSVSFTVNLVVKTEGKP